MADAIIMDVQSAKDNTNSSFDPLIAPTVVRKRKRKERRFAVKVCGTPFTDVPYSMYCMHELGHLGPCRKLDIGDTVPRALWQL